MTLPPRLSELEGQDSFKAYASLGDGPICQHCGDPTNYPSMSCAYSSHPLLDNTCITCRDAEENFHDDHVCPMEVGCGCCWNTHKKISEQGNHNRFAVNDTANDEMYMDLGPIAGTVMSDTEENPEGVLVSASSWVTADVLPGPQPTQGDVNEDMSGAMNQDQPESEGMAPSATQPVSTLGTPSMASSWTAEDYISTIQKKASDSDVYSRGYSDAISGKEMDEGMANLSMDYYQGYKQGLLYNEDNLTSAPASIQDIQSKTYYEMQKSAPNPPRGDTFPK